MRNKRIVFDVDNEKFSVVEIDGGGCLHVGISTNREGDDVDFWAWGTSKEGDLLFYGCCPTDTIRVIDISQESSGEQLPLRPAWVKAELYKNLIHDERLYCPVCNKIVSFMMSGQRQQCVHCSSHIERSGDVLYYIPQPALADKDIIWNQVQKAFSRIERSSRQWPNGMFSCPVCSQPNDLMENTAQSRCQNCGWHIRRYGKTFYYSYGPIPARQRP